MMRREPYWQKMEARRTADGLPAGTFDFVSVHTRPAFRRFNGNVEAVTYSLCSPICIVEALGGHRAGWEDMTFARKAEAMAYARAVARTATELLGRRIFCLDCTE